MSKNTEKIPTPEEEGLQRATAVLGEYFDNFAVAVLDSEGTLNYDYSNYYVGKTLFRESVAEMNKDNVDIEFTADFDVDEEE
jgi:hypothetical protein